MKENKEFIIVFSGLKEGFHEFKYVIQDSFFENFLFEPNFTKSKFQVELMLEKKATFMELHFLIKGKAEFECDLTLEPFEKDIESKYKIIAKFGEEFNDDDEGIIVLPRTCMQIDLAHYIYETLVLAIPSKNIHPKVISGEMKSNLIDRLGEIKVEDKNEERAIDERWNKLKNIEN